MIQFLYPNVRQFPFDETCEQIVRELEKRNWQVPGIDVEFREYGSGEQKFRAVSWIKSQDFKLWFHRIQRTIAYGQWNDIAAVSEIVIPKKELYVCEDESGPTFYLYVGNDYERDREKFMNSSKIHGKRDGKPKMYLQYKGECHCHSDSDDWFAKLPHTHQGRRPPLLVHTNDSDREYDPEGDEPTFFSTNVVMEEFKQYLEEVVLQMIVSHPIPTEK